MVKRATILLTFLAYSLTLIHSAVPHHHHQEVAQVNHHHHDDERGHDHGSDEKNTLSHFFADAIHHPAAELAIHSSQSENVAKSKATDFVITILNRIILPESKPPDIVTYYQPRHYSSDQFRLFLLRAPPAV
jgi:hypothetical protein